MTNKTIFAALFTISILLLGTMMSTMNVLPTADAMKGHHVQNA